MNVRRGAAALAATAVLAGALAPAAHAAPSPSPSVVLPSGLYGTSDPTYDGVFRQSYALLAQHTAGVRPAAKAVAWLAGQQCADGAFAAFRADPQEKCADGTPVDSNSTAAAVQALAALGGHRPEVTEAVDWLRSAQNDDGGWGYTPGLPSDANSTGIVVGALAAAGEDPDTVRSGKKHTPGDALTALALPCAAGSGAFGLADAKTGKLSADADATAAGVTGALGKGLVVSPVKAAAEAHCAGGKPTAHGAAVNGAAYLRGRLGEDAHLTSALPGAEDQPDYSNTADAVVALAAAGQNDAAKEAVAWLRTHAAGWAKRSGPAAWAQLVLAAHATGEDPRHFGGTDLVRALNATGPAPEQASPSAKPAQDDDAGNDSGGYGVWWFVGVCLVAGIGIGFLISGRNKRQL